MPQPLDLHEITRLKGVIETSRNKLKAVFDAIGDPIVSITAQGMIESLNFAAAHLTQEHPRQLAGITLAEFLDKARLPVEVGRSVMEMFQHLSEHAKPQWRMVNDGPPNSAETNFFQVSMVPAQDVADQFSLAMVHIKDITDLKRLELMTREYSSQLEQKVSERTQELLIAHRSLEEERDRLAHANRELKRLDQMRQDLTNMVVHDLKGPLAELMGNLDLLSFGKLDEDQTEARELALLGAQDLYRMIINLLEISRMEEGRLAVKPCSFNFHDLASDLLTRFKTLVRLREFQVELSDETQGRMYGDPDLLKRVLQNLLTNALNHTDDGGHINISAQSQNGGALVSLKDTGSGIPEDMQGKLFEKFAQAGSGKKSRSTGLGLTFCKMAVEAHGGEIWYESQAGQGTTFSFRLPGEPQD